MNTLLVLGVIVGLALFLGSLNNKGEQGRRNEYGEQNAAMVCPHCNVMGKIRTKKVAAKKGISGAKATGAIITGGLSILATGLSRKEEVTQAHCDACRNTWTF